MFTPLRHALSLAVGSALAVSASNAFADTYQSVFGQSYAQYFGGVGTVDAAYDGTKDIQNWKPTEITYPDGSKGQTNLRTIYVTTGLDPQNRHSSVRGLVNLGFSGLNLVNDKGSKPYVIMMSDSNGDKSPMRDMRLTFENSVVQRWNIVVEEPTYRKYFGIEDGVRSTEHSITFRNSEFTGDIIHNSKEAGSMTDFDLVLEKEKGNQLDLDLDGTKWTGATYSTVGTKHERNETLKHSTNLLLANNSHWAVTDDSFVTTLKADSSSDVEILAGTAQKMTKLSIDELDSGVRVNVNDNTSLTVGKTAEPAAAVLADGENTIHELDVRFKGLENAAVAVRADNVSTKLVASDTLRAEHDDNALIRAMAEAVDTKEKTVRFELEADTFSDAVSGTLGRQNDGTLQVDQMHRTTNENALAVADTGSILFMQWRAETDDVMQRMGDVRSSGKTGLWVRHYGGRSEFGSSDYDYLALQMGADRLVYDGDVKVLAGAAFSYTDGDAKYSTGTSDAKSSVCSWYFAEQYL